MKGLIGVLVYWYIGILVNWYISELKIWYMRFIKLFSILILGISSICCSKDPYPDVTDFRILFVGNSLTYSNDLPGLVEKKAEKEGITVETELIAQGNYAIIDHWNDGEVQKELGKKEYHYVVIQQGPSSQPEGRRMLLEDGKLYADLCAEHGAVLCYYMVWPSMTYYSTFDDVIKACF